MAVVAAVAVLHVRDPHRPASYGVCPFLAVTGWDCPLCGGLRATNSLSNADLGAALDHNALFTASVPLLLTAWVLWLLRAAGIATWPRPLPPRVRAAAPWAAVTVLVVFWVVRNLPGLEVLRSVA